MKETEAARAVLLEVLNALGAMRDDLITSVDGFRTCCIRRAITWGR